MNTQMITIASIQRPQVGKKMWAAIDINNQRWGVWPDKVAALQEGGTYEINFKSNDFQGKTYYTIETAVPVGNVPGAPRLILPKSNGVAPPPRQMEPVDDKRRMDIFVCGAFNNILSNPNFTPQMEVAGLAAIVEVLRRVWQRTLGPQAQETVERGARDNELDDKIPF